MTQNTMLAKIELLKNSKLPKCKWLNIENYMYDNICLENNNVGLITGHINNIIVVDIDVKDDGLDEWNTYIQEHGEPKTVTVKTPSGGYHYYFSYNSTNKANNHLIENNLKTTTKYRGKGIDIRSNGGYVVMPPSKN